MFGGAGAINSGLLSDFDDFGQAMNPTILQDWRIGMSIIFNLDTNVSVVSSNGGNIFSSTLDAYNSLSFSKTGPAFLLSEGFTINAPELNIFDNRWVDPRAPVGPSPVPLPASLPLLLLGGLALGAVRHAQRKFVT